MGYTGDVKKHLIFGYRHHKEDELFEGFATISIPWWRSWEPVLLDAIDKLNSNRDLKHHVVITFVTKL